MRKLKNLKIALISHELTFTGAPRSLLNLAIVLRDLGTIVEIWSIEDGLFINEFHKNNFHVNLIKDEMEFLQEVKQMDLAIFNTIFTSSLCNKAQMFTQAYLFVREAANINDIIGSCNLDVDDIRSIQNVICVSKYACNQIKKIWIPNNITIIHNFVHQIKLRPLNIVHRDKIHFLIAGTVEERKGLDLLIKAYFNLPVKLKNKVVVHIAGNKPEWSRKFWEGLIPEHNNIIDHGELIDEQEKIKLYKKMNVFVIPSRDESCSLVALEGAMLGKALILSDHVGAKYLMKNKKYIFESENADDLSKKMSMMCSRRELLIQGSLMKSRYLNTSTKKIFKKNISIFLKNCK